ncbi:hypothetical protein ACTXT7_003545 [Hymenolepis weldensis]
MSGLPNSKYSIDVAPVDLTSLHGDAVAGDFTGVIHISAGDTDGSSFSRHITGIRPYFTLYIGNSPENTDHLSTEGTHSPADNYPTYITPQMPFFFGERRYYQDCPVEDVAARTETKMVPKKASKENLLRAGQRGRTRTIREL